MLDRRLVAGGAAIAILVMVMALAVVLFLAVVPLIIYNVVQLRKERSVR